MGHSEFDPAIRERRPWNAGRIIGAKRALKPQQVWAIGFWLGLWCKYPDEPKVVAMKPAMQSHC